jgi:hypothetical protein
MKQSLEIRKILEVAEVIPYDHQCTAYRFTEALPELDWSHIVVMKHETDVNILIQGNTIRNNRARGVLATSQGKIRIRDNFFHTPGPAVQIEYGVKGRWSGSGVWTGLSSGRMRFFRAGTIPTARVRRNRAFQVKKSRTSPFQRINPYSKDGP